MLNRDALISEWVRMEGMVCMACSNDGRHSVLPHHPPWSTPSRKGRWWGRCQWRGRGEEMVGEARACGRASPGEGGGGGTTGGGEAVLVT
jgi:hypothetical protein